MALDQQDLVGRRSFFAGMAAAGAGTAADRGIYDVRQFGARGGRGSNETARFQAAVDACHNAGGGTVYVPPGDYLCGGLFP